MICNRHHLIATNAEYGQTFCLRCFTEAKTKAEDVLLERKLAGMRLTSADAILRRLGGK